MQISMDVFQKTGACESSCKRSLQLKEKQPSTEEISPNGEEEEWFRERTEGLSLTVLLGAVGSFTAFNRLLKYKRHA